VTRPAALAALAALAVVGAVLALPARADEKVPAPKNPLAEMREKILRGSAQDFGVTPRRKLWGVLMELGMERGAATLVALADGTTSLYLSTGGGVIGAGEHASVRAATLRLCDSAAGMAGAVPAAHSFDLPDHGRVRFYFLTTSGVRTAEAAESQLAEGKHSLSPLFRLGHDVIAEVRLKTPRRRE
jgi:hypothetical protein